MSNTLTESTNISLNIKTVFLLLFKKIFVILLCAALCGIGSFIYYSAFVSPKYTATVSIIADNRTIGSAPDDTTALSMKSTSDITASRLLTDTYMAIFSTSSFLESVSTNVNDSSEVIADGKVSRLNGTVLRDMIKMTTINNTEILEIQVSSSSPQLSVDICYAIMEEAKIVLADTMDQSEVKSVEGDNILIPTEPSSPSNVLRAALGCIVGGFISCLAIVGSYAIKNQTTPASQPPARSRYDEAIFTDAQQGYGTTAPDSTAQSEYTAPVYPTARQSGNYNSDTAQSINTGEIVTPKSRPRPRPQRQAPTAPKQ